MGSRSKTRPIASPARRAVTARLGDVSNGLMHDDLPFDGAESGTESWSRDCGADPDFDSAVDELAAAFDYERQFLNPAHLRHCPGCRMCRAFRQPMPI
jgi:hypothetical protein